jgi:hypothetical protein
LVGQELVPKLKRVPGLRAYHIVKYDDCETGSVSVYDDMEAIEQANEVARLWVIENMRDRVQMISKDVWETLYNT